MDFNFHFHFHIKADVTHHVIFEPKGSQVKLGLRFDLPIPKQPSKPTTSMIETKLTSEQKVKLTLSPKTATGKPARLDGEPTIEVVSGEGTVEENEEDESGLSFYLVSADLPGVTEYLIKADADIGEGVEEIAEAVVLTTMGANAKNLGVTLGTPEPKEKEEADPKDE